MSDTSIVPGHLAPAFPPVGQLLLVYPGQRTRESYEDDWNLFVRFFRVRFGDFDALAVLPEHLSVWRDEMTAAGLAKTTINRRLRGVSAIYEQAVLRGIIPRNPGDPKLVRRLPQDDYEETVPISDEQMRAILAVPTRDTIIGSRDYAMMMVLSHLAVRVTELITIRFSALVQSTGKRSKWNVVIHGKGGRRRRLPLVESVYEAIGAYVCIDSRQSLWESPERGESDALVFRQKVGETGEPLRREYVWRMVKRYALMAGVDPKLVHPHTFRHTAITKADGDIEEIQKMAGHKHITSTMRYRHGKGDPDNSPAHEISYEES